jgi:phage terminase large subunit GpA-like protein
MPIKATGALASELSRLLVPPEPLTLSEWADEHYYLSEKNSGNPGRWQTRPYQRDIMNAISSLDYWRVTVMKSARVGYALALDTPIPTVEGWKQMGDIKKGDKVFGLDGKPCDVLYVSPVYDNRQCYRVEFCDGSSITADAEHRWYVESDQSLEHLLSGRAEAGVRPGRPPAGQARNKSGVISTAEMERIYRNHRGRTTLTIPTAQALALPSASLLVPPYTLGLWLGDGHKCSARITGHILDVEIKDYIEAEGIRVHVECCDSRYPDTASYFLDAVPGHHSRSPWTTKLKEIGVLYNKHIPAVYLRASREQRLSLLRGLMDSDGTNTGTNSSFCEFNNTNLALAEGVYELAASLGMKPSFGTRKPQQEHHLLQYRVTFKGLPEANPFKLRRKAEKVKAASKPAITYRRRVVLVEKIASVPVRCIQVSANDSLFLAGKSMVPTHNTKILNAAVAYHMAHDPCPMSLVQPTAGDAEEYSRDEISSMISDVPAIREIFQHVKFRDGTNNLVEKHFPGGILTLFGANSPGGFRRITRRVMLLDEIDGYPMGGAGNEGDQVALAINRTIDFWNRTVVEGSTPTIEQFSKIEHSFQLSDQRRRFVPCPHCGTMQYFVWKNKEGPGGFWWEKDKPETAVYICNSCEKPIEHRHKRWMDENGEWRPTAVASDPRHVGFHIWAAYSPQANATWSHMVAAYLQSKENMLKYQTFVNTWLGETWKEDAATRLTPESLMSRREEWVSGTPPDGVLLLTCGVDVQDNRLEATIVGWGNSKPGTKIGPEPEAWMVAHEVITGHYSEPATWKQLDELLQDSYTLANGAPLQIATACVDSGDGEHAPYVYDFCHARRQRHVIATKGHSMKDKDPIGLGTKVEYDIKGRRRTGATVYMVGVDGIKTRIMSRLRYTTEPGPGYFHFPVDVDEEYFDELTSEYLHLSYGRRGEPRREWKRKAGARAEKLDCMVYNFAALHHTYKRFNKKTMWDQLQVRIDALAALAAEGKPLELPKTASRRSFNVLEGR